MWKDHPLIVISFVLFLGVIIGTVVGFYLNKGIVEMLILENEEDVEDLGEMQRRDLEHLRRQHLEEARGLRLELFDALMQVDALSQNPRYLALLPKFTSRDRSQEA
jgi:hypothetical protein